MSVKRFTDEEINKANNINIMDYVNSLNLETKKTGKTIKVKGYGGLYVNPNENKWYCFSRNKGGGPIQFVMFMENKTWVEAIKELIGNDSINIIDRSISFKKDDSKEVKDFILPEKNKTYKHMIAYLIRTRQIDKEIVYKMIKEKKLYEDKNQNCVFVGYDNINNPKYANRRGTNTNIAFKGEIRNSDKSHPFYFGDNGDTVYVFESPIDALSHATIYMLQGLDWENEYRLSLGGLAEIGLDRFLKEKPKIKNITLCLDNDGPGHEAKERLLNKYRKKDYNIDIYNISEKDINKELIKLKESLIKEDEWEIEI